MNREDMIRAEVAQEALPMVMRQRDDAIRERDALQKRCDEAHAALALAFGTLVNISLLTRLGGEVDEYSEVTRAVREEIDTQAIRGDTYRARALVLVKSVREEKLAFKGIFYPAAQHLVAELRRELREVVEERDKLLLLSQVSHNAP